MSWDRLGSLKGPQGGKRNKINKSGLITVSVKGFIHFLKVNFKTFLLDGNPGTEGYQRGVHACFCVVVEWVCSCSGLILRNN